MYHYELSKEADKDLDELFDYTVEQFGMDQAIRYVSSFERVFERLCSQPKSGRLRVEIRKGLRSVSPISHTVFYRNMENRIRIVRVLHSSRDIIKFIPPQE